jgi:UDP-3-O-[3-hydroxymyristoyl] glucosamine N-acyltransferase
VEHDCVVGDHTTFGPGVFLSGFVHVGRSVRFGTLIGVEPDVTIGDGAVIASGLAVTADVPAGKLLKAFQGRV